MSHSSYTASERRGILAIALIALLLMAAGIFFARNKSKSNDTDLYEVNVYNESKDTVAAKDIQVKTSKKRNIKKTKKSSDRTKQHKTYRRRSPLDEPV